MKIACFGDSHGHYFRNVYPHLAEVETYAISGASMIGFGREHSKLQTKQKVLETIPTLAGEDYIVLMFGQVDIEFVFYHKNIIKDEAISFEDFVDMLVKTYIEVILEIKRLHRNIVVCGINLPTIFNHEHAVENTIKIITANIDDDHLIQTYKNKLNDMLPSMHERTRRSIDFNASLKKACLAENIQYFDLTKEVLDPTWGFLSSKFRPFEVNHHYPLTYEIVEIFTLKLILTIKGLY
jgi:hypothetical protein